MRFEDLVGGSERVGITSEDSIKKCERGHPVGYQRRLSDSRQVPKEVLLVDAGYVPWVLDHGESETLVNVAVERLGGF